MPLDHAQLPQALAGAKLPAAFVHADALDRNADLLISLTRAPGPSPPIPTKSIRPAGILGRH
jgi:hypothetical protein